MSVSTCTFYGSSSPAGRSLRRYDMPQLYNNAVITDAGLVLLDRVQAGTASIQFTRMVTGDGTYTTDEKTSSALQKYTGLKSEKNSYPLSSVSIAPNGGVKLAALITNQDPASGTTLVSEGYYINEIGLFAREKDGADSTEVLYSITVARGDNGDYMPPYGGDTPVQIVQEYHAKVSNTTSVTINSAGAVMLAEDAQREFEDLKRMIGEGGAIEDKTLTFEEAEARENIASGDRMDTILGKIRKFFVDLKRVAFTASYNDLVDTPDIPTVPDSLPASNVTSTYSSTGTEPVNGKAVDEALKSLDVAAKGGEGKYIQSISETDGKIAAVEAIMPTIPRSSVVNATIPVDGWSGTEAPFSHTVTVGGVTATSVVQVDVQSGVTAEQLDAFINAKIVDGGQGTDSVTLKAFGERPAVNIPVKFVVTEG